LQKGLGGIVTRRCTVLKLLLSIVLVACLAEGANAHSGMLALFADTHNHECHTTLGAYQTGSLYLTYVRGDGPRIGAAYEFKLLKSTANAFFLDPIWPASIVLTLGTIETGISLTTNGDCFPDQDYLPLGTIPIMNVADPDTFTVAVVPDPQQNPLHAIVILKCLPFRPVYVVSGGTFVFNAGCPDPLNPFGALATRETSWGAIKELYR
jgi:hypothetical protein